MIPNKSFIDNLITFILIPYFIIENDIKRRMCAKFYGFLAVRTILVFNISNASSTHQYSTFTGIHGT